MRLRDLLDDTELRLEPLVGGEHALEREFHSVMSTDLPDPRRYLAGGELLLTGMVWRRTPEDSAAFVAAVAEAGIVAIAAGDQFHAVPDDLIEACRSADVPLLRVPADIPFDTVTARVTRTLGPQRAEDVATLLGQHRNLAEVDAAASDWLGEILELVHRHLGLGCAVLTPTGHVRASAGLQLSVGLRAELVRAYLTGKHLPATVSGQTLYGVGSAFSTRVLDSFLVFAGDCADWGSDRYRMAGELAALVAMGCKRISRVRENRRPLVEEIVRQVRSGTDPAGWQPRFELAGIPADASVLVIAAQLHGNGTAELARSMLEELLDREVALQSDQAIALVPVEATQASSVLRALREDAATLADGLGSERVLLGTSGVVVGTSGLQGALDEARHACRLSELRGGKVVLTGHEDLSSHMMLLAAVPDEVRQSFRRRVLGPVLDYDSSHGSDLVQTLWAFLENSGSWTKCARELHVHVNTLRYRIQRVEQLTGRDLSRIDDRVDFYLAFSLT